MNSLARKRLLALLFLLVGTACDRTVVPAGPATSRADSAGVELVDNHLDPDAAPVVQVAETLRIGSVEGPAETQFFLVRSIALGPQDELFIGLGRPSEVRVFSGDGEYLRTIGGPGQGPGEYADVNAVVASGSSVTVVDLRMGRITQTTFGGEFLGSVPVPRGGLGLFSPAASFDDGWAVLLPESALDPMHGVATDLVTRVAVVSGVIDPFDAIEAAQANTAQDIPVIQFSSGRIVGMEQNGVPTGQIPLWEPRRRWGVDEVGRVFVTARDQYRIDVFDPEGRLARRVRRNHDPVANTSAMRSRFLDAVVSHYDTMPTRSEFGTDPVDRYRFLLSLPGSGNVPILGRLEVSGDGAFMVERPDLADDPVALEWARLGPQSSHWDVFASDGTYLGTATLPATFTPHLFNGTDVVGVERDELGVEFVVRYELLVGSTA